MVRSKADLIEVLQRTDRELRARGVSRLGLFGSFARDEARPDSDVDLLIDFQPGRKSFDAFMGVAEMLESLLDRRVELVTTESLSPHILPHVMREVEFVPLAD